MVLEQELEIGVNSTNAEFWDAVTDEKNNSFSLVSIRDPSLVSGTVLSSVLTLVRAADVGPCRHSRVTLDAERFFDGDRYRPCRAAFSSTDTRDECSVVGSSAALLTEDVVLTSAHGLGNLLEIAAQDGASGTIADVRFVFRDIGLDVESKMPGAACDEVLVPEEIIGQFDGKDDHARDWALVRVRKHAHPGRAIINTGGIRFRAPRMGESLRYAGHPGGLPLKTETGPVKEVLGTGVIKASMDVISGASGSPVFDDRDRLIGVLRGLARPWQYSDENGVRCLLPRFRPWIFQGITPLSVVFDEQGSNEEVARVLVELKSRAKVIF